MNIATTPTVLPERPYRGIEPFRYVDQPVFFERDAEVQHLLQLITIYRGVLCYGESGVGKSSLINAGLIPGAEQSNFAPHRLRVQPRNDEEIVVERISVTGDDAAPYLPNIFADENESDARVVLSLDAFRTKLARFRLDSSSTPQQTSDHYPLLIFDQFEELVTLFEVAPRREALKGAKAVQKEILDTIVGLLCDSALAVKFLFVFREDYLAKLTKLLDRCPGLQNRSLRVSPLQTDVLERVIRGPFDEFPGHFTRERNGRRVVKELSPHLATRLAEEIRTRSDTDTLNLSEVQIACLRLWEAEDPEKLFERENPVRRLLEDYLSDALKQFPQELRNPAIAILSRLVTSSGTRNVISEHDLLTRIEEEESIPKERLHAALDALEKEARLITRERRHDIHFFEIVSEFLVPWIAQKKVERRAEAERLREKKRLRRLVIAGVSIIVIFVVGAVGALIWPTVLENRVLLRIISTDFNEVDRSMEESGFLQQSEVIAGMLREGENVTQPIALLQGEDYGIAATCDGNCGSLDLRVYHLGEPVPTEVMSGKPVVLGLPPLEDGEYQLAIAMVECAAEPCTYAYRLYHRPPEHLVRVLLARPTDWQEVGYAVYHDSIGVLPPGQSASVPLDLQSDTDYVVLGFCDQYCGDLNLALSRRGEVLYRSDEEDAETEVRSNPPDKPFLAFTMSEPGQYRFDIQMADCIADACYFGYRIFSASIR